MVTPARSKLALIAAAFLLIGGGVAAAWNYESLLRWLSLSGDASTIMVSGNIEAHQSVLGFKTVHRRIVELLFDEGPSVKAGSMIC